MTTRKLRAIDLELADRRRRGISASAKAPARSPSVNLIVYLFGRRVKPRLFISHRDTHKVDAQDLADALKPYGISAFVAHDTIEPMTTWQREIEGGLATMEVMVAFITDDFHDSDCPNQEVGIALGKSVPVIPVKFERTDPKGFIGPSVEGL